MAYRDTQWLMIEACREFQRGTCKRSDAECKYAHPGSSVTVENGRVTACFDSLKVRAQNKSDMKNILSCCFYCFIPIPLNVMNFIWFIYHLFALLMYGFDPLYLFVFRLIYLLLTIFICFLAFNPSLRNDAFKRFISWESLGINQLLPLDMRPITRKVIGLI